MPSPYREPLFAFAMAIQPFVVGSIVIIALTKIHGLAHTVRFRIALTAASVLCIDIAYRLAPRFITYVPTLHRVWADSAWFYSAMPWLGLVWALLAIPSRTRLKEE